MKSVKIGNHLIGTGQSVFVIADIGINHNGDIEVAKKLITAAVSAGCNAVKFQKRTIDVVYTKEELMKSRENPFGPTNGDLKRGLEFDHEEYAQIDRFCRGLNIMWFVSCWDEGSVDFIDTFGPPCYKIASACLTDDNLLKYHRKKNKPILLSSGMSTVEQIEHAMNILGKDNLILLHCTSTYPSMPEELNLRVIPEMIRKYDIPIGYSGHEVGLYTSLAAVVLGACVVERHITLDRSMWGSDQAASVEAQGFIALIKNIRAVESAMGDGRKKVYDSEIPIIKKLRRVGA